MSLTEVAYRWRGHRLKGDSEAKFAAGEAPANQCWWVYRGTTAAEGEHSRIGRQSGCKTK